MVLSRRSRFLIAAAFLLPGLLSVGLTHAADERMSSEELEKLHRQATAVSGDTLSDLMLALELNQPVGKVGSLDLSTTTLAGVEAALVRSLAVHRFDSEGKDRASRQRVAHDLRGPAAGNAYYALALLSAAHDLGDLELQREALRAGANAGHYDSPFTAALDSLLTRYARLDLEVYGKTPAHLRGYEPAFELAVSWSLPPLVSLMDVCKVTATAFLDDCAVLAQTMYDEADTAVEVAFAGAVLDRREEALSGRESIRHRRPVSWILAQSKPLLDTFESWPEAEASRFIARIRTDGELVALKALLLARGLDPAPPCGWDPRG